MPGGAVAVLAKVVGVVACAAGGVERLRVDLVEPLVERGRQVAVILTPTAALWLDADAEIDKLEATTGLPVRSRPRLPGEQSPHPRIDLYVVAPATANTVAKLALGIADNHALTVLCENIATTPMIVFPRINAAHARQPAWDSHLAGLRGAGVRLIYGDDVWPLYEPRLAPPDRPLPWGAILEQVDELLS
jgi:phosphopantothenoylcysteine synthetase/decarboxylase